MPNNEQRKSRGKNPEQSNRTEKPIQKARTAVLALLYGEKDEETKKVEALQRAKTEAIVFISGNQTQPETQEKPPLELLPVIPEKWVAVAKEHPRFADTIIAFGMTLAQGQKVIADRPTYGTRAEKAVAKFTEVMVDESTRNKTQTWKKLNPNTQILAAITFIGLCFRDGKWIDQEEAGTKLEETLTNLNTAAERWSNSEKVTATIFVNTVLNGKIPLQQLRGNQA